MKRLSRDELIAKLEQFEDTPKILASLERIRHDSVEGMFDKDAEQLADAIEHLEALHGLARQMARSLGDSGCDIPVRQLPMTVVAMSDKARGALSDRGVYTVADLLPLRAVDLLKMENFGRGSLRQIDASLEAMGLQRQEGKYGSN